MAMQAHSCARRISRWLPIALCAAVGSASSALGQDTPRESLRPDPVGLQRPVAASALLPSAPRPSSSPPSALPASWLAPAASLIVPGAGQAMLKQPRAVAYLVADVFFVLQYMQAQRDGNRDRRAYRDLAAAIARKPYGGTADGPWEYYEAMEHYLASGAFDMVAGGDINPETDESTYNGYRWLLARQNYWSDPAVAPATSSEAYRKALAFYQAWAVPDAFLWSWRDQQLQQDVYRQTIRSANRSYQRAKNLLGLVAMNHLASLIDAYVSVRIRRYGGVKVGSLELDGVTAGYENRPSSGEGVASVGLRFR